MPWFWGRKQEEDDDELSSSEYDSDEYTDEEYSEEEEEEEEENVDAGAHETSSTESLRDGVSTKDYVGEESAPLELSPEKEMPRGSCHSMSTDGEASMLESDGIASDEEGYLDTSDEEEEFSDSSDEETSEPTDDKPTTAAAQQITVETVSEGSHSSTSEEDAVVQTKTNDTSLDDSGDTDDSGDEEEAEDEVTSFWEKQSLLVLAAEHDRVDILKAILSDDNDSDKEALLTKGVPPLHMAISFGSTNTTQSLLRMGADPSLRPSLSQMQKDQLEAPKESRVEIPNLSRFEDISAWELAFGNEAYQAQQERRWSVFSSSDAKVIAPVQMAPSKREGIRHAFTAEALRCIGGDELPRLKQLIASGMPTSIEIGGKDLYEWAVQLGGLNCEEFLRPTEAAKHGDTLPDDNAQSSETQASGKVLDRSRPGDERTVAQLCNRLDELDSLASALSTCLDNLAEDVSVCHGLLLLGGGASALASHVKSLNTIQAQKQAQLANLQAEWVAAEEELAYLISISGDIGQEVQALAPATLVAPKTSRAETLVQESKDAHEDEETLKQELLAQIAASDNTILKLRASIADLSEESARELAQVEQRGLSGGIRLVRGLREELRDLEFSLAEAKTHLATCQARRSMIQARLPKTDPPAVVIEAPAEQDSASTSEVGESSTTVKANVDSAVAVEATHSHVDDGGVEAELEDKDETLVQEEEEQTGEEESSSEEEDDDEDGMVMVTREDATPHPAPISSSSQEPATKVAPEPPLNLPVAKSSVPATKLATANGMARAVPGKVQQKQPTASERIQSGDSQALALKGNTRPGYFTVDLWQVLLRIIGLDQAAARRGIEVTQKQKQTGTPANLMIV